jgi:hypothetical protein
MWMLMGLPSETLRAEVERYKDEAAYLARLEQLGYEPLQEDFEGSAWGAVRSDYPLQAFAESITSQRMLWQSAAPDLWTYPDTPALISTKPNWARGTGSDNNLIHSLS